MEAPGQSWPLWDTQLDRDELEEPPTRTKRARVTIACQRCKTRKQKCDGNQPCEKCSASDRVCEYNIPQKPMPFGKDHYIKALERRVADLERLLTSHGIADVSTDHWSVLPNRTGSRSPTSPTESPPGAVQKRDSLHDGTLEWQDGIDSVSSVLRSLSLDINGSGYVGASSQIAFGRLFGFINCGQGERLADTDQWNDHTTASSRDEHSATEDFEFADMSHDTANRLFAGYIKHVATRWPIVHSVWARNLHNRRCFIKNDFETTTLHLVYATSGRFLETTGEYGHFNVKRHFNAAIRRIDAIIALNDVRSIQVLMLMAVYCLRDPVGAGAWIYNKTALLIAIDHGMHRRTRLSNKMTMANELRKRLFWACYSFDRQISIPMGRPFGISDRDIDISLPCDIDEDITEEQLVDVHQLLGSNTRSTSLTLFNMVVQLRRIESDIQQTIYRVDQSEKISDATIKKFLVQLEGWASRIPTDTRQMRDQDDRPFDGYDHYMIFYHKCRRLLLYPQITKKDVTPKFLKDCAGACAGICGAYKRLHQVLAVGYSLMALQTVFMAGLTLVYCLWISPHDIFDTTTTNGIHDCSVVLFVIAERVPAAKKYRNAFEIIRQRVIDRISDKDLSELDTRKSVPGLTADLAASGCYPIESNFHYASGEEFDVDEEAMGQLSHILTDMSGMYESGLASGTGNVQPQGFSDNRNYEDHDLSSSFGITDVSQFYDGAPTDTNAYTAGYMYSYGPSNGSALQ